MKLQTKITLVATISMLFLSMAFSLWNLSMTQRQIMDNILLYEAEQLQNDIRAFGKPSGDENAQSLLEKKYHAQSVFRSGLSRDAILYYDGEEIDNRCPYIFDIKNAETLSSQYQSDAIPEGSPVSVYLEELNGKRLLFLYESNGPIQLLHYRDVTEVFHSGRRLLYRGIAVAGILSVLLAALLMLTIRRILIPFYQLRDAANVIADGDYQRRVDRPGTDEIGQVSQSFNRMADRVEEHIHTLAEMNEKQRQLLGSLAHELKTPLGIIRNFAENLLEHTMEEKRDYYLTQIVGQTEEMDRLAGEMILVSRMDSENLMLQRETVSFDELIWEQLNRLKPVIEEKKLEVGLQKEQDFRVEGDKDYLAKAVRNLLSNAAAYNVPEGRILITLKEKSCAIENTGFPLSEEQLKRSFELFYSGNKSQDGKHMGMGLYLAEKIFSRHGLSIALENTKIRVKSTVSAASR